MVKVSSRVYEEDWEFENSVILDYAVYDSGAIKTVDVDDVT